MTLALGLPSRFELVRELGRGAMGTVYEAIDRETGGRVALKALTSTDVDVLAHFKREFRELQDIDHPNLVTPRRAVLREGSVGLLEGHD